MTRLTDERLAELYAGTLQLVASHGFERLTMDAVAEATHSSKATLYRQWGSKTSLVAAALQFDVDRHHVEIDTGSLRGDLLAMLCQDKPEGIEDGALIGALLHAVKTDAELARVLREQVVALGRERIDAAVQRGVDRGEVAPDSPGIGHVALLIIAQFVLQPLVEDAPSDDTARSRFVDEVLLPILGIH